MGETMELVGTQPDFDLILKRTKDSQKKAMGMSFKIKDLQKYGEICRMIGSNNSAPLQEFMAWFIEQYELRFGEVKVVTAEKKKKKEKENNA